MRASRVLNFLKGDWNFTRMISGAGQAIGRANFVAGNIYGASALFYREEGIFEYKDTTARIYKEYMYLLTEMNISVYFSNDKKQGDLFHVLEFHDAEYPQIWQATACHICARDIYNTKYVFHYHDNKFEIRHTVKGPNKDYISDTTFERLKAQ